MTRPFPAFANNPLARRADAQQLACDLFEPLRRDFSEGRARVHFGDAAASFDRAAAELEGFSRPLWGIAPLVAGGGAFDHLDYFREGLGNGSDPAHRDYWGEVADYDQRAVEMAAIGYALAIAPEKFWDPLSGRAKDNLSRWLRGIEEVAVWDDNWHFFVVLVQLGLERVGVPIDAAVCDFHLDRIESFYLGDGWYGDGPEGFADHYNGYALHCYGLLYAALNGEADRARSERYVERAKQFAQSFRLWFADDGASIPYGRSMTYRFAMTSAWAALAVAGVEALPWPTTRGLWARHIRWWLGQPMTDEHGRLTVGFRTANPLLAEQYNSPNSPYWAMKALLPLSLPAEHPFWMAPEQPADNHDETIEVAAARFIARRQDGQAILLPGGPTVESVRNAPDKYAKFAYSSAFGFSVESDRWCHMGYAGDNALALSPDGRHWRVREIVREGWIENGRLHTRWSPWPGCEIETAQFFLGDWEIRAHRIEADRAHESLETGHAVAQSTAARAAAWSSGIAVGADGAESRLVDYRGLRALGVRAVMPNTNNLFPSAAVPVLAGRIEAGETLLVTAVHARPAGAKPCPILSLPALDAALIDAGFVPARNHQASTSGTKPQLVNS
jgi:hypothetical protein